MKQQDDSYQLSIWYGIPKATNTSAQSSYEFQRSLQECTGLYPDVLRISATWASTSKTTFLRWSYTVWKMSTNSSNSMSDWLFWFICLPPNHFSKLLCITAFRISLENDSLIAKAYVCGLKPPSPSCKCKLKSHLNPTSVLKQLLGSCAGRFPLWWPCLQRKKPA